ncbi:hypothetical protein Gotur_027449 [Gossypium turneri]
MPGLTIGATVPNLEVETTNETFKLHDYFNNGWTIIFSHPSYLPEFEKRGVKLLGLSCDEYSQARSESKTLKPTQ